MTLQVLAFSNLHVFVKELQMLLLGKVRIFVGSIFVNKIKVGVNN